jgi:eukaryotic-like serine/threonine-protein kinase
MLLDRYEVGGLLGAGSLAEVYEGYDRLLARRVAIKVLRAEGPPPGRAAELAEQVCGALAAAHARGLVHGDIEPGNIMLTRAGQAKVLGFAVTRAAGSAAVTGLGPGRCSMPTICLPSRPWGQPVDPRSDLYSLGCVLYELLTGQPPFAGATPLVVASRHVREDPAPPRRWTRMSPPGSGRPR